MCWGSCWGSMHPWDSKWKTIKPKLHIKTQHNMTHNPPSQVMSSFHQPAATWNFRLSLTLDSKSDCVVVDRPWERRAFQTIKTMIGWFHTSAARTSSRLNQHPETHTTQQVTCNGGRSDLNLSLVSIHLAFKCSAKLKGERTSSLVRPVWICQGIGMLTSQRAAFRKTSQQQSTAGFVGKRVATHDGPFQNWVRSRVNAKGWLFATDQHTKNTLNTTKQTSTILRQTSCYKSQTVGETFCFSFSKKNTLEV